MHVEFDCVAYVLIQWVNITISSIKNSDLSSLYHVDC